MRRLIQAVFVVLAMAVIVWPRRMYRSGRCSAEAPALWEATLGHVSACHLNDN